MPPNSRSCQGNGAASPLSASSGNTTSGCGVIESFIIPSVRGPEAVNRYVLTDLGRLIVNLELNLAAEQLTGVG
jgi:hypothetical protein